MLWLDILIGKIVTFASKMAGLGDGSTWPGHIVLKLEPNFLKKITKGSKLKVVFVAGTNGKTTTSAMVVVILKQSGKKVFQNNSGANLKNGVVSAFATHATLAGEINYEYAVLEVDENALPLVLKDITPHAIILTNLFRDQLDRYGELNSIAEKWNIAFDDLTPETRLFLNADDPLVASLGANTKASIYYFGLEDEASSKVHQHASDSIYCSRCKAKLIYTKIYYSHLGHWSCASCGLTRPKPGLANVESALPGLYNKYNALAASYFALKENLKKDDIAKAVKNIEAVFGRQEKIKYGDKNIQIFLSKNPTSFNQTIATIFSDFKSKTYNFLFVLNDNIPDGRDVSWIWDIDIEQYMENFTNVVISGHRVYDMAIRFQYAQKKYEALDSKYSVEPDLKKAINTALEKTPKGETLYIIPTYSAMLNVRKILTGKKIL